MNFPIGYSLIDKIMLVFRVPLGYSFARTTLSLTKQTAN